MPDGNTDFFISWYLDIVMQPLTLEQCSCLPGNFEKNLIINLTSLPGTCCEVLLNTPDIYYTNTALQSPYRSRD